MQNGNGIYIKTWQNDESDTCLPELLDLLKEIVRLKIFDVKDCLLKIRDMMTRLYLDGDSDPMKSLKKKLNIFK